jgi:hypothetical protein
MRINSSGSVGIGTSSPAGLLHLASSSGDTKLIIEADTDNNNEDDNAFIIFRLDGGLETAAIWHGNATGTNDNSLNLGCSTTVNGGIKFFTSDVNGYENAIERMQIDSSGNVGIGTTSPQSKLDVDGQTLLGNGIGGSPNLANFISGTPPQLVAGWSLPPVTWTPSASTEAVFARDGDMFIDILASNTSSSRIQFSDTNSENVGWIDYDHADNNMNFRINGAERLRIDSSGNVGIGTTSPSYKLEVNGSFAATTKSFVIDHPSKPNYKLRYGSLEGPENGVYVRGKSIEKSFTLPDYWKDLVHEDSITIQLTPIGSGTVYVKSYDAEIISVGGTAKEYFYYVMAERKDVERFEVEYQDE